jgi:hypothetical protein
MPKEAGLKTWQGIAYSEKLSKESALRSSAPFFYLGLLWAFGPSAG